MSTLRIQPLDSPYSAAMQADFDRLMNGQPPLLLFKTVAKNPRVLQRMMAGGLLDKGSISMRIRELIILRTCGLCAAEYEWGVHVAIFGKKLGWTKEELYSTVHGTDTDPCWDKNERYIIQLCDQLHQQAQVSEKLWTNLSVYFTEAMLIEITMLAGLYHAVSFMVNVTGVENESFAPIFPAKKFS